MAIVAIEDIVDILPIIAIVAIVAVAVLVLEHLLPFMDLFNPDLQLINPPC